MLEEYYFDLDSTGYVRPLQEFITLYRERHGRILDTRCIYDFSCINVDVYFQLYLWVLDGVYLIGGSDRSTIQISWISTLENSLIVSCFAHSYIRMYIFCYTFNIVKVNR